MVVARVATRCLPFCAREVCAPAYRPEKGYTNKDIISAASIPREILGAFLNAFVPRVRCMQTLEQNHSTDEIQPELLCGIMMFVNLLNAILFVQSFNF